jgi:hypothetical protein
MNALKIVVYPYNGMSFSIKRTEELDKVAHSCNTSYPGGRYQEDHNLTPAKAKC